MGYDIQLQLLGGKWHDKKGNCLEVVGGEVKILFVGREEWKAYEISEVKGKAMLNGAKVKSITEDGVQWSSAPCAGGGMKWMKGYGGNIEGEEDSSPPPPPPPPQRQQKPSAAPVTATSPKKKKTQPTRPAYPSYGYSSYYRRYTCESSSDEDDDGNADYPLVRLTPESLRYTPMRLSKEERKDLRTIEAAIRASDYTDLVDNPALVGLKREAKIYKELEYFLIGLECSISGLDNGVESWADKDLAKPMDTAKRLLEIARRHKMGSPNTSIAEYGKLLYLAQDCYIMLGEYWGEVTDIKTAEKSVEEWGLGGILEDCRVPVGTTPVPRLEPIRVLNKALRRKTKVQKQLKKKYGEDAEQVIYSIDDRNVFIEENAIPIVEMIRLAKKFFDPENPTEDTLLTINEGEDGSRLSHDHRNHYYYVIQSLAFWKNILRDMAYLWVVMERDMLSSIYDFRDTGQGFNRVHKCTGLYNAVDGILQKTKEEVGAWVGSERIHIGDNQVPNGLHFIDKYTQVARIIRPIISTLSAIEAVVERDEIQKEAIEATWGTVRKAQLAILRDFFRFGFDGSGGNNDDDAGSCIDGRLTSAWNWCSLIRTKPYYPIFLLAGFSSFDSPK